MKIGLMTCFLDNYGACLQAYALQTTLQKSGNDVEIIRYMGERGYRPAFGLKRIEKNAVTIWLRRKIDSAYEIKTRNWAAFDCFRDKYLRFSSKRLNYFKQLEKVAHNYDLFVCGSDQIWNPTLYNGNNRAYFLDFVPKGKKRVAYAPSIGIPSIPEDYKSDMRDLLNKMDVLTCREQTGSDIVEDLVNKPCRTVLDPTLLLSKEEWGAISRKPMIQEPYIFCYIFGTRPYISEFVKYAKEKTGLRLVAIPYTDICQETGALGIYDAGPEDFISLIHNASLVITDSFHATAFSLNLNTPFYSLLRNEDGERNNMNSRILDILAMLNMEDRLISPDMPFPEEIVMDVDFSKSNENLYKRRESDTNYLFSKLNEHSLS